MFESALAYCPASRMADNAVLFKHVARTTGLQHGVVPTFMAKPYGDQPGCSGHVHLSLRDKDGKNVFAVGEDEVEKGREGAPYEDVKRISQVGEWFLAGILAGLPDIVRLVPLSCSYAPAELTRSPSLAVQMPCLVPTVNGSVSWLPHFSPSSSR